MMTVPAVLEDALRARLVKRGGLGYEQPSAGTFPAVEDFIRGVLSCGAIPMVTWLDGTSAGEADGRSLLECMAAKGAAALNIIPDRNWNIEDPDVRAVKRANLAAIVAAADEMGMPINIGTEMNRRGLPFVDRLDVEALQPHKETFMRGARIMVGHSILHRYAAFSYVGEQAEAEMADIGARNDFFESVGRLPPLDTETARSLEETGPKKALERLRASAARP
jgi:hypothetical protein